MQAGQTSHFYTIAAPREFFAQWLAHRLAAFRRANPEVRYQLIGGDEVDFTEANLDVAVRLVEGPDDLEGVQLAPAQRVTVAADNAPDEWIAWPGAPLPEGVEPVIHAGNAGQALSAALAGLGKALLPLLLCEEAIEAGKLKVLDGPEEGRRAYWLVAPRPQWRQKKVRTLVAFLSGEA
jgi:LysR family glycine cleavage system transcriptional activator